jgi:uncharacterized hydrophobic protein (TIGR00271 family)
VHGIQDALLGLLGNHPEARPGVVAAMMHRDAREAMSYWLQLVVSVGIATLGLVVGSSAVVIGAMLIAPLMGPIVGLAMGLAAGSPFLVLRSAARVATSVLVVVAGAAVITLLLPFHELNGEIAARTSPTVLDLVTAAFCALAGVYASLRPGSDTATTAAGTSIGISLVPPLCASGYGVGTASLGVAAGAALLFLTNLVAIVVVGTVSFVAAGFNRAGAAALEREELAKLSGASVPAALARRLARLFESRFGPALRFLMPFALLAVVYLPLRRALDEVAWQVRARSVVNTALAKERVRIVDTRVRVERHQVDVVLVILGDTKDAEAARARLQPEIELGCGVAPRLEISAVPDAAAFAGLESTLLQPAPAPAPKPLSPKEELDRARERVERELRAVWPTSSAGAPLAIDVGTSSADSMPVRVVHIGVPLGTDGAEAVRRALEERLEHRIALGDVAIAPGRLTPSAQPLAFVAQVAAGLEATHAVTAVSVCGTRPGVADGGTDDPNLGSTLDAALAAHPRAHLEPGDAWSVEFVAGPCPRAEVDAGAADAVDAAVPDVKP